jgi:SAM-dependent methyltransferase
MEKTEYIYLFRNEKKYWWHISKRVFINTFLSSFQKSSHTRILDAGCGTGGNISLLRQYGHVEAVDVSPIGVALCKKRGYTFVKKASIEKLPFPENSFDLITLFDVLYHRSIHDDVKVLRHIYTRVKPGGYLLVTDCAFGFLFGPHDVNNHARTRYSLPELKRKLRQSGFTVVRGSYMFCFTFPLFTFSRLLSKIKFTETILVENNIHPFINTVLLVIERVENAFLRRINLPFGSSVIILAQRRM